jgi:hypothetical protein
MGVSAAPARSTMRDREHAIGQYILRQLFASREIERI